MAKNKLVLDVVWQTNAKQALGESKNEFEKLRRDFESKPLTVDINYETTQQSRQNLQRMRQEAEDQAKELQRKINQASINVKTATTQENSKRVEKWKDELERLTAQFKIARSFADQLSAEINKVTMALESMGRAQKAIRSQDIIPGVDTRLGKIKEQIALKQKDFAARAANPELYKPNSAGTLKAYGTRKVNELSRIEQEILEMGDRGELDKGQVLRYQKEIEAQRRQAEALRGNATAFNRVKPQAGYTDEVLTRQQVLRSGGRVVRTALADASKGEDVTGRLQNVIGAAQEQRTILQERMDRTKNTTAGSKTKQKLAAQIDKLNQIEEDAHRAIEAAAQRVEQHAKQVATDIRNSSRQQEAQQFFSSPNDLLQRIRSTTDKDELLRLKDELTYHHKNVGQDFNTKDFNHQYNTINRELQGRMNKLGVADPTSLRERLFGSKSPYGRLYGSSFNRMNHLITNVSQMGGLSLYGMGAIGLGTAAVRGTIEAAAEQEAAQLGIAGAANKFLTFTDARGNAVSKAQNLRNSLIFSKDQYERLREASKNTGVTTRDLAENFSTGFARLSARGLDPAQITEIVSRVVQLGRLQGLPGVAIASDIRDFAAGTVNAKSQVLTAMGLSGEKLKEFYAKGDAKGAYGYFQEQIKPFEGALNMYRTSIAGQQNALAVEYEKTAQIVGGKLAPAIIPMLQKLQEAVTKWADSGAGDSFVRSFSDMASGFIDVTGKLVQYLGPFISNINTLLISGIIGTFTLFASQIAIQQLAMANPLTAIIGMIALFVTGLYNEQQRLSNLGKSTVDDALMMGGDAGANAVKASDKVDAIIKTSATEGLYDPKQIKLKAKKDMLTAGIPLDFIPKYMQLDSKSKSLIFDEFFHSSTQVEEALYGSEAAFKKFMAHPLSSWLSDETGFSTYGELARSMGGDEESIKNALRTLRESAITLGKPDGKARDAVANYVATNMYDNEANFSKLTDAVNLSMKDSRFSKYKSYKDIPSKLQKEFRDLVVENLNPYMVNKSAIGDETKPKVGAQPPLDIKQTPKSAVVGAYYSNRINDIQSSMSLKPSFATSKIEDAYNILKAQYGQASANYMSQLTTSAGDPNAMYAATLEFQQQLRNASQSFAELVRNVYLASKAMSDQISIQRLQIDVAKQQIAITKAEAGLGAPGSKGYSKRAVDLYKMRMDLLDSQSKIANINAEREYRESTGMRSSSISDLANELTGVKPVKSVDALYNLVSAVIPEDVASAVLGDRSVANIYAGIPAIDSLESAYENAIGGMPESIRNAIRQAAGLGAYKRKQDQVIATNKRNEASGNIPKGGVAPMALGNVSVQMAEQQPAPFSGEITPSGVKNFKKGAVTVGGTRPRYDAEAEAIANSIGTSQLLMMGISPDMLAIHSSSDDMYKIILENSKRLIEEENKAKSQAYALALGNQFTQETNALYSLKDSIYAAQMQRYGSALASPQYASVYGPYGRELDNLSNIQYEATLERQNAIVGRSNALANGKIGEAIGFALKEREADEALRKAAKRVTEVNQLISMATKMIDLSAAITTTSITNAGNLAATVNDRGLADAMSRKPVLASEAYSRRFQDATAKYNADMEVSAMMIEREVLQSTGDPMKAAQAKAEFLARGNAGRAAYLKKQGFGPEGATASALSDAYFNSISNSQVISTAFRNGIPNQEGILALGQQYSGFLNDEYLLKLYKLGKGRQATVTASMAAGGFLSNRIFPNADPAFATIGSQFGATNEFFTKTFGDYGGILGGIIGAGLGSLFGGRRRDPRDEQHKRNLEELLGKIEKNTDPRRDMFDIRPNDGSASAWYSQRAVNPIGYQFGMGGL